MTLSRKTLCVVYAAIALLALVGTWGNVLGLVGTAGFVGGTVAFWHDVLVNESSRFITVDTLFLGLAVTVWMVLEARRLRMPGVWVYVVLGLLVAISVMVPLFLVHRELTLAAAEPASSAGRLEMRDVAGIALCGLAFTAFALVALSMSHP